MNDDQTSALSRLAAERVKLMRENMQLRAAMSPWESANGWIGRGTLANLAGLTFHGRRDSYEALGYQRILLPRDYRARYKRGGIAQRIVEAMPLSSWRGGGSVYEDEDPKTETDFEKAFLALNQRLHVWQIFERADILAGLGRYGVIVLGGPGDMGEPLTKCSPDQLHYIMPYGEDSVFITEYDQDWSSVRFGLPIKYALRRTYVQWPGQMNPPMLPAKPVHFTRVIHLAEGLLDDPIFGKPRLESVWNLLDDLDKVIGGGAEAFWKRADGGTQFDIDKDMVLSPDPALEATKTEDMRKKFSDFTHELERMIVTRGIKINRLGSDTANLKDPASAILDQISATIGIPQRILMGSEMGKLASSKDKSNWDDRVQDRRDSFCGPMVVRPFIDRMIALGVLPTPKQYENDWPETDELDQGQRVTAAVQISMVNKNEGSTVVTPDEIRETYLGLEPLTPQQRIDIQQDNEAKAAQAQAMKPGTNADGTGAPPNQPELDTGNEAALAAAIAGNGHAQIDHAALERALIADDLPLVMQIVEAALAG